MSEWIIVAVVGVVLLFSAKKLPDMARGLGQSMRIFKAETRGLKEDDERARTSDAPKPVEAPRAEPTVVEKPRETVPDETRRAD
ncbi:Sec-independent protein translocase subunit TatA [Actinomycetospora chiangmaiensis]|uniref:Sec-independent protein translocase subunit TatA n=1 Tax=Actinomycetospora chiangmaiensis TaxID=402650 RepID=UPI00035EC2E4|nr:Sec-independent protein translocase subunit TatA [Actinomycetospora chiangmaiensis]